MKYTELIDMIHELETMDDENLTRKNQDLLIASLNLLRAIAYDLVGIERDYMVEFAKDWID